MLLISEHEMVQIDRKSLYTLVSEARKMNGGKVRGGGRGGGGMVAIVNVEAM